MISSWIIAFNTIVRKEFLGFARIWIQTILPSVITMFLYITIFEISLEIGLEQSNHLSILIT